MTNLGFELVKAAAIDSLTIGGGVLLCRWVVVFAMTIHRPELGVEQLVAAVARTVWLPNARGVRCG